MIEAVTFSVRRPLITIAAAAAIADQSADDMVFAVEEGKLQFSWDIAQSGSRRRAIRVLSTSLADYLAGKQATGETPAALAKVIEAIIPALAPTIQTSTFCRLLDCESGHVIRLIRSGELQAVNQWRRGPGGSALLTRSSCVDFLRQRRIG